MVEISPGAVIGIPCQVKPGPFSEELLISLDTTNGPISGLVMNGELKRESEQWYVRAVVQAVEDEAITVRTRGSLFTTNGIATISSGTASADEIGKTGLISYGELTN